VALAGSSKPAAVAASMMTSKPITATEIKVNISEPDRAQAAAATLADGVGLLRIEHMILGMGKTPNWYIKGGKSEEYIEDLVKGIKIVADAFYPRPVWVRTLDAPTDEFRAMEGGEGEPVEHNPMLGWRGIRRDLTETDHFRLEIKAFKKLHEMGLTNVGIMLPMVQHVSEFQKAKAIMFDEGLDMEKIDIGIMVETPAAASSSSTLARPPGSSLTCTHTTWAKCVVKPASCSNCRAFSGSVTMRRTMPYSAASVVEKPRMLMPALPRISATSASRPLRFSRNAVSCVTFTARPPD